MTPNQNQRLTEAVARTAQYRNANAWCHICARYGHVDELHRFEFSDEGRAWELAEMDGCE